METTKTNKDTNKEVSNAFLNNKKKEEIKPAITNLNPDISSPEDLIDDLKNGKIDSLTEGKTNLGYEERSPRKKELEEKEHYDQDDK
jgi:hypothetical protein